MTTPLVQRPDDAGGAGGDRPRPRRRRGVVIAVATVAVIAVVALGLVALTRDGDDAATPTTAPPTVAPAAEAEVLELTLGQQDTMAMCLAFDVPTLAAMSPAFAATVTAVDGSTVTMDVDRWYAGGDAPTVELTAMSGMEALIDGFTMEVGHQYLVTATDGSVNFCGYSGPATPELTAAFDSAFS